MQTFLIIGFEFLVIGATLVAMWRLLKERDFFHNSAIIRHQ